MFKLNTMLNKLINKLLLDKNTDKVEDEDFLWRWMHEQYRAMSDPNNISSKFKVFLRDKGIPLFKKLYHSIVPEIKTIKNIFQLPDNINPGNTQTGGGMNNNTKPMFYKYRVEYFNKLITFLDNKQIILTDLSKQVIQYLYIYKYTIDYIKMLDYTLFLLNDIEFPTETRTSIQHIFNKLSYDINRGLSNKSHT